jgi:hypothetical protein
MSYKCLECGHIFEEGEESRWCESRGEFWGTPCSEEMSGCPLCKGEYEETIPCEICGAEHLKDELTCGVCDECIDERRNDFETCYKLSKDDKTEVKINSLLASLFDSADIEQILKEYVRERCADVDCSQFIDDDISWFAEMLVKEVKNNEKSKN